MQRIETIGIRLKSAGEDIKRFIDKPKAIREVNSGLRSAESLFIEHGLEAFTEANSDKAIPCITEWLAGISKDDSHDQLKARNMMHEIMTLAAKKHRLPERIAPWMVPIAEAIQKDKENKFQLDNETIQTFFAGFPYVSAARFLEQAGQLEINRWAEHAPGTFITWDMVTRESRDRRDKLEMYIRPWYFTERKRENPVRSGIRKSWHEIRRNIARVPDFGKDPEPVKRLESFINDNPCGTVDKKTQPKDSWPKFEGMLFVNGRRTEGALNVRVFHTKSKELWYVSYDIEGIGLAVGMSYGEAHSLQEALDIAVERGFVPSPMEASWREISQFYKGRK